MSRRIIVSAENTKPEIRQSGYVYQKGRKKSDLWIPTQRAYGFFRVDVPGKTKQQEIRKGLGFCRNKMIAMLKLHQLCKMQVYWTWRRFGSASHPLPHSSPKLHGGLQKLKQGESLTPRLESPSAPTR